MLSKVYIRWVVAVSSNMVAGFCLGGNCVKFYLFFFSSQPCIQTRQMLPAPLNPTTASQPTLQ